jgi:hypothetical protein
MRRPNQSALTPATLIQLSSFLVAVLALTDCVLAGTKLPIWIDFDCVADRRDGVPLAEQAKQTIHVWAKTGQLYTTTYTKPFNTTSRADVRWEILMSTTETLIAAGYQMIAGSAARSEILIIYHSRGGEFRHVILFDGPPGTGYTKAVIETGFCLPHTGL